MIDMFRSYLAAKSNTSKVVVWSIVSNKRHIMPPNLFSQGFRVNIADYIKV